MKMGNEHDSVSGYWVCGTPTIVVKGKKKERERKKRERAQRQSKSERVCVRVRMCGVVWCGVRMQVLEQASSWCAFQVGLALHGEQALALGNGQGLLVAVDLTSGLLAQWLPPKSPVPHRQALAPLAPARADLTHPHIGGALFQASPGVFFCFGVGGGEQKQKEEGRYNERKKTTELGGKTKKNDIGRWCSSWAELNRAEPFCRLARRSTARFWMLRVPLDTRIASPRLCTHSHQFRVLRNK